jgi:hypothetical protein
MTNTYIRSTYSVFPRQHWPHSHITLPRKHVNRIHNLLLHNHTRKQPDRTSTLPVPPPAHTGTVHAALPPLARSIGESMSSVHGRQRARSARSLGEQNSDAGNVLTYASFYHLCPLANSRASDQALHATLTHLNAGNRLACIQTTCHAGTHRSVAAAEILAVELRRRGVQDVRVLHAHRQRRSGDR